ncbi:hypothetical protein [Allokutzneria albata]|uniref:hypothetical protein n=1 Tax=Allokutzneria albata TaxID=211114 RepID=UPI0012DE7CE5|nr:hypothetical protein [Allokutzneria albata]
MSSRNDTAGGWHLGFTLIGLLTVTAAFPSLPANPIDAIVLLVVLGIRDATTGAEMIGTGPAGSATPTSPGPFRSRSRSSTLPRGTGSASPGCARG